MMPAELRVALIGYGYWGPNLARNLVALPGVRLVRVCELDPARRAQAQHLYPWIEAGDGAAAVCADQNVDAVVIATPLATHFPVALAALDARKHVLVEKPIAATAGQARQLIEAARRQQRVLMVDHPFVYAAPVRHLGELIARGELGRLLHYDSVRANLGPFHSDVDVIWDLAAHDLSILERLTGRQPFEVSAIGAGNGHPQDPEIAHLMLRYDDGLLAHLHLSWLSPVKIRRTTLVGTRALVMYDALNAAEQLRIYAGESPAGETPHAATQQGSTRGAPTQQQRRIGYRLGDMISPRLPVEEPLQAMCAHFVECVRSGVTALTDGGAGLRVVTVLEAARHSLALGGTSVAVQRE